ncbi:MAG: biopolymer transporter ExbD [Gammaproteobacteria bacterium]|nr:biopolymer transporter ExbD [Gammaproteobacteria bacterium]
MNESAAERMQKNHRRFMQPAKLNLVSLMDIFTILVFFLLINTGDNELLKNSKHIKLPDSIADTRPEATITVMVTVTDVIVDGRPVATMEDVVSSNGVIPGLAKELDYLAASRTELSSEEKANGRAVTILGDHTIPYEILKRVMMTCARSNYRDLSMAVTRVANAGG